MQVLVAAKQEEEIVLAPVAVKLVAVAIKLEAEIELG